jgi:23S rRNA pseudouridine955/2504/2580 synthase/23S rRNA pseudouridine1911/1915/1917 synthase
MKIAGHLIFENEDFVVINKPAGLLSIPDREGKDISLKTLLREQYGEIYTVHRLDKGTSGVMVFARNAATHHDLSAQFENRQTEKTYFGLVNGIPAEKEGTINAPLSEHPSKKGTMVIHRKGKEAITLYRVACEYRMFAWMEFRILTGRTHQIRVHMKDLGHPILCDDIYGDGKPLLLSSIKHRFKLSKKEESERPLLNRLALHSSRLAFTGRNDERFEFEAPLPKDLTATLSQLGRHLKHES